eukprot:TRINITY_DN24292_c0_g1_i3.p1 TRINITY_DN24292_c0_g1~~TRINITY_DN24292_c0_g1_i3.p1  ORF type:complete len:176 (-),score=33.46 TRINITY_DN24292_c0_g1_i3:72-599(-)
MSVFYIFFFFNVTATTEIYTRSIVGSVRCVQETGINAEYMGTERCAPSANRMGDPRSRNSQGRLPLTSRSQASRIQQLHSDKLGILHSLQRFDVTRTARGSRNPQFNTLTGHLPESMIRSMDIRFLPGEVRRQFDKSIQFLEMKKHSDIRNYNPCLLYTSPSPRDLSTSRMPSSA